MVGAQGTPELAFGAIGQWAEALEDLLARGAHRFRRVAVRGRLRR
jgi:hypothetical protein